MSYPDLPEDLQVLIADLCRRVDDLDDSSVTFEVFALDIPTFPVIDLEDDPLDTRYLVDHLVVPWTASRRCCCSGTTGSTGAIGVAAAWVKASRPATPST